MVNRMIRFRAWDINKTEMIYDGLEYGLRCLRLPHEDEFTSIGFSPSEHLNFKIMQFTGLYDKNGVEIYEGDVVQYRTNDGVDIATVVYDDAAVRFRFLCDKDGFSGYGVRKDDVRDRVTVIGNIYENPELLEDKQ